MFGKKIIYLKKRQNIFSLFPPWVILVPLHTGWLPPKNLLTQAPPCSIVHGACSLQMWLGLGPRLCPLYLI